METRHQLHKLMTYVAQNEKVAEARADLFGYIEFFYTRNRRHGYFGNISPVGFEPQATGGVRPMTMLTWKIGPRNLSSL